MDSVPEEIQRAIEAVDAPDRYWSIRASTRQSRLTMPPGSLGRLLGLGRQIASIQRTDEPSGTPALVAVFAADHGVARSGVSAYPSVVTGQMVANYLAGGAAVNVLARRARAAVHVVDMGVANPPRLSAYPQTYHSRPVRRGTHNFVDQPAMSRDEAFQAVQVGLELGRLWTQSNRFRVVALGEMGIGNTTTASALLAALTGADIESVVGRGTGVDDEGYLRKCLAVTSALERHGPEVRDVWDWLARLGGFEILGLAGLAIAAAGNRAVVVLDGLISTVAGLVAARLCPKLAGSLVGSHVGPEPGHRIALDQLGLDPLLDLGLRLGEGTGAVLALPLIASAADILRDMATFEGAGVSGPVSDAAR